MTMTSVTLTGGGRAVTRQGRTSDTRIRTAETTLALDAAAGHRRRRRCALGFANPTAAILPLPGA